MSKETEAPKICYACKHLKQVEHYGDRFDGDWCDKAHSTRHNDYYVEYEFYCNQHPEFRHPENLFEPLDNEVNEELQKSCEKLRIQRDKFRDKAKDFERKFDDLKSALS